METARIGLEISTGWAQSHPDLYAKSVDEFLELAESMQFPEFRVNTEREGFITYEASKGERK